MASEVGVLDIPEERIIRKWRLQPGKMLLIDMEEGRIIEDEEIKASLAQAEPYESWLADTQFKLEELKLAATADAPLANDPSTLLDRQQAFGYTQEDLSFFLEPIAASGEDPIGSMGSDTPIAVLSRRPKLLYEYFKQNFAQVTNPPIDPIREELVMSLVSMIGPRPNLLGRHAGSHKRLEVAQPILTDEDLAKIRAINELLDGAFRTATLDATWAAEEGADGLDAALDRLCREATDCVLADMNILILSDRGASADRIPIPAALATAAVHHHLIRQGLRMQTGLVIETGEAREVHHFCVLAGYGAEAVNPYLAFETLEELRVRNGLALSAYDVRKNYIKAIGKGVLKVMSEDGHLHLPVLLRRADLRRRGPLLRADRQIFHRHRLDHRGRRPAAGRRGVRPPPSRRLWRQSDLRLDARRRRGQYAWAAARRGACLDAGVGVQSAACGAGQPAGRLPRLRPGHQRAERTPADHPRD